MKSPTSSEAGFIVPETGKLYQVVWVIFAEHGYNLAHQFPAKTCSSCIDLQKHSTLGGGMAEIKPPAPASACIIVKLSCIFACIYPAQ